MLELFLLKLHLRFTMTLWMNHVFYFPKFHALCAWYPYPPQNHRNYLPVSLPSAHSPHSEGREWDVGSVVVGSAFLGAPIFSPEATKPLCPILGPLANNCRESTLWYQTSTYEKLFRNYSFSRIREDVSISWRFGEPNTLQNYRTNSQGIVFVIVSQESFRLTKPNIGRFASRLAKTGRISVNLGCFRCKNKEIHKNWCNAQIMFLCTMRHKNITYPKKIPPELFFDCRCPIWDFSN